MDFFIISREASHKDAGRLATGSDVFSMLKEEGFRLKIKTTFNI
jgi:hypothetical protein